MRKAATIIVGALLAAGCAAPAGQGPASPAPTTTPETAPSRAAVSPLRDGPLLAGRYSFLGGTGSLDVPAGWEGCCAGWAILKSDFAGLAIEDLTEAIVYADACRWKAGPNPAPHGAEAFATAFSEQAGHQGTEPEATTVAGMPAWRVTLTVPADQPVTDPSSEDRSFTGCDEGKFASWGTNGGGEPSRWHQGPSQIDTLHIVDVGGRTIAVDVFTGPDIASSDQAELDAMLASITFTR